MFGSLKKFPRPALFVGQDLWMKEVFLRPVNLSLVEDFLIWAMICTTQKSFDPGDDRHLFKLRVSAFEVGL